jgi:hypothetical protein
MNSQANIQKNATMPVIDKDLLTMISPAAVRLTEIKGEPDHCAIWDYNISPAGRHYFSVCAEGMAPEYVRLYEYFPETGKVELKFRLEDVIITYRRAIRASKIHSSIDFLPDGRLIMATHTTACAPGHPRWMPFAYYPHQWEGYPGSNLLIYDPDTCITTDLGIPVQRESIYGGVYDETTNSYYFSGYHRGHVYRFDLSSMAVADLGQATEFGTWRYIKGLDGNLYSSTASGRLFRINIREQRIEDIGTDFPVTPSLWESGTNNKLMHYAHSQDGKLYFTALSYDGLMRYDYASGTFETVAPLTPPDLKRSGLSFRCMGMDFDSKGCLWYICEGLGFGCYLVRNDIAKGTGPETMGLLGSRERVFRASFGVFIRQDTLYASDTSRSSFDSPAILRAELDDLRCSQDRVLTTDPVVYMKIPEGAEKYRSLTGSSLAEDAKRYYAAAEKERCIRLSEAFSRTLPQDADEDSKVRFYGDNAMNATMLGSAKRCVVKIWKTVGCGDSCVDSVSFDSNGDVVAVCGKGPYTRLTIRGGDIIDREPDVMYTPRDRQAIAEKYDTLGLPYQPERRHLAYANAECELLDGKKLVGTRDGMLALIDGGRVFSLGAVSATGPVHDLASSPDGTKAIGVAGDPSDLGIVFTFDTDRGVILHGRIFFHDIGNAGVIGASSEPYCVAYAPDGKSIAIGVRDRLGCLYRIYF